MGIEPIPQGDEILSPTRLPVPPYKQKMVASGIEPYFNGE